MAVTSRRDWVSLIESVSNLDTSSFLLAAIDLIFDKANLSEAIHLTTSSNPLFGFDHLSRQPSGTKISWIL